MRFLRPVLFAPLLVLTACAAESGSDVEHATTSRQAIIGGATSTTAQDATVMIVTNGRIGCTGTLITPNLVLTERHCVAASLDETTACGPVQGDMAATSFAIALGVNAQPTKKVATGKKLYVPSSTNLCGFDIALIQLDADVPNAVVARTRFEKLAVGETVVAVGYGSTTSTGAPSTTRRQRQTTVQAIGPTSASWPAKSGTISYDVPVSNIATGESTCFGDSGGPLFDEGGNVVGVTSRGIDGECLDRPSIYTSVAAHQKLILDAANAAGHSLDDLSQGGALSPQEGEGDPGDVGDEDGVEHSAQRRSYQPQANTGCASAPRGTSGNGSSLLAALAFAAAASFRRRSQNK